MVTAHDVPVTQLIKAVATKLQQDTTITPPEWGKFVRTGIHKENPPEDRNWWYTRCASILRKIYIHNSIGVEHLRSEYGGKQDKGSKPYKAKGASGSILRHSLQQLEKAGYVTKVRGKGRSLTPKGQTFLDNTAHELMKTLQTTHIGLQKY
jgi:small subunit ribosomal protein S19e